LSGTLLPVTTAQIASARPNGYIPLTNAFVLDKAHRWEDAATQGLCLRSSAQIVIVTKSPMPNGTTAHPWLLTDDAAAQRHCHRRPRLPARRDAKRRLDPPH
jgi:hypothetical protein